MRGEDNGGKMKITIQNKPETDVTIKEVHIILKNEIPPDNKEKFFDLDDCSYSVKVVYEDGQFKEQTGETTPLTGNSIITLTRQHDKGTCNTSKEELHLKGTQG